jgi:hypothetical protein
MFMHIYYVYLAGRDQLDATAHTHTHTHAHTHTQYIYIYISGRERPL